MKTWHIVAIVMLISAVIDRIIRKGHEERRQVRERARKARKRVAAPVPSDSVADDSVPLSIKELTTRGENGRSFELTYGGASRRARFGFFYRSPKRNRNPDMPFRFDPTSGRLESKEGSDNAELMEALDRAHGQDMSGAEAPWRRTLEMDVVILGDKLAEGRPGDAVDVAGRFKSSLEGPWIVAKLFIPAGAGTDDEETAEIFLCLNPAEGRGQFLVKDPDYWQLLEQPLASIL